MNGVAYCRYSSSNQNYVSIESQLRIIRDFATKKQIQIIREYLDPEKSASIYADKERPEFQRMIQDIQENRITTDYILFYAVDRFARNEWDFASLKKLCREKGVRILYAAQDIPEGAFGSVVEGMYQNFAIYYSIQLSEHVRRQKDQVATQGLHRGGPWPVGYTSTQDHKYQIDPNTTGKARSVFSMYAAGQSLDEISATTELEKYTIRRMLRNPIYAGYYVANVNSKTEKVILPGTVPATVDKEMWDMVQDRINGNKQSKPKKGHSPWILTGRVFCGECGSTVSGNSSRGGRDQCYTYNFYVCTGRTNRKNGCKNKSIQRELLEDYVMDYLKNCFRIENIEMYVDEIIKRQGKREQTGKEDIPKIQDEIKTIEGKMKNLLDGIAAGTLQHAIAGPMLTELDGQKKVLKAKLNQVNKQKVITLDREVIRQFFLDEQQLIMSASTPEEKKIVIDRNIEKVVLYMDEIETFLKIKEPAGEGGDVKVVFDKKLFPWVSFRNQRPK